MVFRRRFFLTLVSVLLALCSRPADTSIDIYRAALELNEDEFIYGTFPPGFQWTIGTSAYQIEGGWDADGKGEHIWDRFAHTPGKIESGHTGDVACDSYNKYEEDIANIVSLGVSHYRFSISWARLQPTGVETTPNPAGVLYYNNLIDGLLAAGIEPTVTLYHWDLPQALEDQGGWLNEALLVPAFADYARLCYQLYGDRVKYWITLNEPWVVSWMGYGNGQYAPGYVEEAENPYIATHTLIKAHAEAYHVYNDEFRPTQNGNVGITFNIAWMEAKNRSIASDMDAAYRSIEFDLGWFANPIYVNGDYPDAMKLRVAEKSALQGYSQSRLPSFTTQEKQRVQGTSDFFGLNFYTANLIYETTHELNPPSYWKDKDISIEMDPNWPTSGSSWLIMYPPGMRKILNYIHDKYGQPPILITENGISARNNSLTDGFRINYFREYLNNVLQAIDLDGVNVIGYTAWALMDLFEWNAGHNERFGLWDIDFNNPARPRTIKDSASYFRQVVTDNGFPAPP